MKIIQFNAENIKRLVAVEIKPEGNLVEITGKNGQGKTSILDSILWAMGSNKAIQSKPVRSGEDTGIIRLDLGKYIITKKFKVKEDGNVTITLTVTNEDGAKYSSPQELLNQFIGDLTFDPLAFSRMKPQDQVVALRALVKGYDFEAADKANKSDFDKRTDVNRNIRDLQSRIEAIVIPEDTPSERMDASALMAELSSAINHNNGIETQVASRANTISKIEERNQRILSLKDDLSRIQNQIDGYTHEIEVLRKDIVDAPEVGSPVDVDAIKEKISASETINRNVALYEQKKEMQAQLRTEKHKSEELTQSIETRKTSAANAVREADLPIDGIELTEDGILLNGEPFDQASDSEQLRVSIAVAGAMNPGLKVIRVRDGSLLDKASMALLTRYAEENDLQVWIETVQSDRETAVVIEDGRVLDTSSNNNEGAQ